MATNPITSDDLTIDLMDLLSLSVSDRVQAAASDSGFAQALMQSLTPIQMAKAFPDYYRRELPDISNFILANRYLDKNGAGSFNQTGGGDYGTHRDGYGGETALPNNRRPKGVSEPTLKEMKEKLIEKGINIDSTYAALNSGAIMADDENYSYLAKMTPEELKAVGMEKTQDANGKSIIKLLPTEASALPASEVMRRGSDKFIPGTNGLEGRAALAKQTYDAFIDAGLSDKQARSMVAEVNRENSLNPQYMFGTHTEVAAQAGGRTNFGIFSWGDPSRVKNFKKYMQENGVMDNAGNLLVDNDAYLKAQAKFSVQEMQGYDAGRKFLENKNVSAEEGTQLLGRYIGWDMAGRRHDARASYERLKEGRKIIDEATAKMGKVLPENPTPEQIEHARNILDQQEKEGWSNTLTKKMFNTASPTSSDFKSVGTNQIVNMDEDVMYGRKPLIEGSEFAVPIYTNAKNGQKFDENLENLTPQAIERLKQQAIAAKAAGLDKLELYGAQTHEGHASHGAGTETDLVGYNPDGSMWTRDQRATTALGAVQLGGANRVGLYGSGRGLHVGMADEVEHGPKIPAAWGPGGKTSGVSVGEFTPGLEQELAAYLKGQGPMPQSTALNDHIQRMQEAQKKEEEAKIAAQQPKTPEVVPTATPDTPKTQTAALSTAQDIRSFQYGGSPNVQDDEDLLAVGADGKPRFKFNSGEGLYVKPEANEYADSKLAELSDKMDQMSQGQQPQRKEVPQTRTSAPDKWAEKVAAAYRTPGTQQRAFSRAQFRSEGRHVGDRGSPNIS